MSNKEDDYIHERNREIENSILSSNGTLEEILDVLKAILAHLNRSWDGH